jgi:hypothetical protein
MEDLFGLGRPYRNTALVARPRNCWVWLPGVVPRQARDNPGLNYATASRLKRAESHETAVCGRSSAAGGS